MLSADARLLAASSPAGLAHVVSGGRWTPYEHLILLNDYLLRVAEGEIDRLIVAMPPRHGKSALVSHRFPAWYLGTFPDRQVMLTSYEASFAAQWGRRARDVLEECGQEVFGINVATEPRAANAWQVAEHEGIMVTAGVGGGLTGKGAHLLIIDDPVKNAEQAASSVYRERAWEWWQSTAATRIMPGGACVLVMTRWHEDDLAGRMIRDDPERWRVLNLPAIAEADDELGRDAGEALCPELYDEEALAAIEKQSGGYYWNALYQQKPAPAEGFMFKRRDLRYWHIDSEMVGAAQRRWYVLVDEHETRRFDAGTCPIFQTVDVALSSRDTADWTVVATWAVTVAGDLLLLDVERRQFEEQQTVQFLAAANDNHDRPPMWIERFGAGRNPLGKLGRLGHPVMEIPSEAGTQTDKVTRAFGAVALLEAHKLFLPSQSAGWRAEYEKELTGFPTGSHDDQVDVTSYAARLVPNVRPSSNNQVKRPDAPASRPISRGMMKERF